MASQQSGLRERKKQETRDRIQGVALDLFADRGFDRVTVTEVAAAADVSPATVFNYFTTKEDLVLEGMATYGRGLIELLRERDPNTSLLEAFRDHIRQPRGALATDDPSAMTGLVRVRGIIADSSALQARELLIADALAAELGDLLADHMPEGVKRRFLATAIVGITQAMTTEIHRLAADGLAGSEIASIILPQGAEAVELLMGGTDVHRLGE